MNTATSTGHTSTIETAAIQYGSGVIYRAVCVKGCGHGAWRNLKTAAQTDARTHLKDFTEAETYRSMGGTDW